MPQVATIQTIGNRPQSTYISALTAASQAAYAFGATLVHRITGEEINIDILVDSESYADVVKEIRVHYPTIWGIFETWQIDEDGQVDRIAA